MATKPTVFIDGEAGTTGIEIRKRLEERSDIELLSIDVERRKDSSERARLLNECTIAILCLPDEAAREAVNLIKSTEVRVIDASTAHRTGEGWTYGFPELTRGQAAHIAASKRVSNPGCYPTGALALIRPLVDSDLLPRDHGITINAVSGYSGGGRELIKTCEDPQLARSGRAAGFCLYGLDQKHKHLPEIRLHGGLEEEPIFLPSYSSAFYRGMLVYIALRAKGLKRRTGNEISPAMVNDTYLRHFKGSRYVIVDPLQVKLEPGFVLTPLDENDTNNLRIRVFANPEKETLVLTATLDNLGKGASGAAIQNMDLMLGKSV